MAQGMLVRQTQIRETTKPKLNELIKKARLNAQTPQGKRLAVTALCRELGISTAYWYQIENGGEDFVLNWDLLIKIQQVLGVNFEVSFDD